MTLRCWTRCISQATSNSVLWRWPTPRNPTFRPWPRRGGWDTPRLKAQSFKFYMDGALGSRGAALLEPYDDRPGHRGLLLQSLEEYEAQLERIHADGFQAATHAIGDSAARLVLAAYERVLGGPNDRRWRVEHAQVIHPDDMDRFGESSIIPSVQPTHATSDMYWAGVRLGARPHSPRLRLRRPAGPVGHDSARHGLSRGGHRSRERRIWQRWPVKMPPVPGRGIPHGPSLTPLRRPCLA